MSRTENAQKIIFISVIFLYNEQKLHKSFQARQTLGNNDFIINEISDVLPLTKIRKFGRMKFNTRTVLSCNEVLISLFILLKFLLSS